MIQTLFDMHKQGVFKLEGAQSSYVLVLAVFFGGWATIIAGFLHRDDQVTSKAIRLGVTQLLLQLVIVGQIWAILTAFEIVKESGKPLDSHTQHQE